MEGTRAAASATPILDREEPLPPELRDRSWIVGLLVAGGIGGLGGLILALDRPAFVDEWFPPGSWLPELFERSPLSFGLTLVAALGLAFLLQWGATLLAARCAGLRTLATGTRIQRLASLVGSVSGGWGMLPRRTDRLVLRIGLVLLAGPAANLVLGGIVLLLLKGQGLEHYAWMSVIIGFVTLLPLPSRGRPSAGLLLWKLRDRAWAGRMRALLLLARESEEGVLPEDWSPRLLEEAVAVTDESPHTVVAHALAYSSAFYRGAPDPARFLETCLRFSGTAGPAWRETLMSNAAVWQARQRGRADLAERWLA
ncbi:MAG TPA: hypothetical protein VF530_21750, partial [Planctomycetota bacterium]